MSAWLRALPGNWGPQGAGPGTRARECHAPASASLGSIEDVAVIVETEQMLGEVMGLQKLSSDREKLQTPGFNSEAHKPAELSFFSGRGDMDRKTLKVSRKQQT